LSRSVETPRTRVGKDSLTLLQLLLALRRKAPIAFEVGVCTVDPLTDGFNPAPLQSYVRDTLGLPYHFEQQPIIKVRVS
jgi:tRNA 2-thiocytidine biosynthesis protein TtcA